MENTNSILEDLNSRKLKSKTNHISQDKISINIVQRYFIFNFWVSNLIE